jgi:hypothetical protein
MLGLALMAIDAVFTKKKEPMREVQPTPSTAAIENLIRLVTELEERIARLEAERLAEPKPADAVSAAREETSEQSSWESVPRNQTTPGRAAVQSRRSSITKQRAGTDDLKTVVQKITQVAEQMQQLRDEVKEQEVEWNTPEVLKRKLDSANQVLNQPVTGHNN